MDSYLCRGGNKVASPVTNRQWETIKKNAKKMQGTYTDQQTCCQAVVNYSLAVSSVSRINLADDPPSQGSVSLIAFDNSCSLAARFQRAFG